MRLMILMDHHRDHNSRRLCFLVYSISGFEYSLDLNKKWMNRNIEIFYSQTNSNKKKKMNISLRMLASVPVGHLYVYPPSMISPHI